MTKNKAIFLDKDGVINKLYYDTNLGIIHTPILKEQFEFVYGAIDLLQQAKKLGYLLILVSNQPNIGIKKMSLLQFKEMKKHLKNQLKANNIKLDGEYYCLHHPHADLKRYRRNCKCRKPNTLLYEKAIKKFNIDPKNSWAIGDGVFDIIAGNKMKVKTILLANVNETIYFEELEKRLVDNKPNFVVKSLTEAIRFINSK